MYQLSIALIAYIMLLSPVVSCAGSNPKSIDIPIAKNSYDVKHYADPVKNIKQVTYKAKSKYPADNIITFYENEFLSGIWTVTGEERTWKCFADATLNGSPIVKQFLSSWVNKELKAKVVLSLKYVQHNGKWDEELHVVCKLHPLLSETAIKNFFERLESSGEFVQFMGLIDRYRKNNQKIDIDKAIKENKDNPFLKEYKKIFEDEKKIIEESKSLYQ